jgi:2-haloacid dehalogenase
METVKALFFDVGGTVFDWRNTVRDAVQNLGRQNQCTVDEASFADDWRKEMFKVLTQVRQGDLPWMNADGMLVQALEPLACKYSLLSLIDDPMALVKATWHRLRAFEGAAEAVTRLRSRYTVAVLTILSWESVVGSSKAAGVLWDGILSCEFLGYYKPSRQAYLRAVRLLGLRPEEGMMVAAHEGDLAAAQGAGLHTAYVGVAEKDFSAVAFGNKIQHCYDVEANDFAGLCNMLGVG